MAKIYSSRDLIKVDPSVLSKLEYGKFIGSDEAGKVLLDKDGDKKLKLKVKAPVTHSSRMTKNRGLYQPRYMKMGARKFIEPFKRPVLLKHDAGQDSIGRVGGVEYIDIVDSKHFKGKASLLTEKEYFQVLWGLMEDGTIYDPSFEGLGFIRAEMDITDKDAIEKFLDERYMTFSIRTLSEAMLDCHTGKPFKNPWKDYTEEEEQKMSPYRPYQTVDNKPGFVVTRHHEFPEVSVINIPADEFAIVESMEFADFADEADENQFGSAMVVTGSYDIVLNDNNQNKKTEVKLMPEKMVINDSSSANAIYEAMSLYIAKDADASSLSEADYESLGGSSFCGPNRSFPITDKAHLDAARAVVEESEMSDSLKSKLFKAFNKKSKKLGLEKSDLEVIQDSFIPKLSNLSDFDISPIISQVLKDAHERGLDKSDIPELELWGASDSSSVEPKLIALTSENASLKDSYKKLSDQRHKEACKTNALLTLLKDNLSSETFDKLVEDNSAKDIESLIEQNQSLFSDESIQDGIKRFIGVNEKEVTEEVENPVIQEDSAAKNTNLSAVENMIRECYIEKRDSDNTEANQYLDSMVQNEYVTKEFAKSLRDEQANEEENK